MNLMIILGNFKQTLKESSFEYLIKNNVLPKKCSKHRWAGQFFWSSSLGQHTSKKRLSCVNSLITAGPSPSWSSCCPAELQQTRCSGMHMHPVESQPDLGFSVAILQCMSTCCDMQDNNHFTSVILFSWLWETKTVINIEVWLIAQPYC